MKCRKVRVGKTGWSYWQKPIMMGYLMQCCNCELIHEAEFRVYRTVSRSPDGTKTLELAGEDYEVGIRMKVKPSTKEQTRVVRGLLKRNLEQVCYVAVGNGVISRMLCAQTIGVNIADLDEWIIEYEKEKP